MSHIRLEEEITGTTEVKYVKKRALIATVCDGCGKRYHMRKYLMNMNLGTLQGRFDRSVVTGPFSTDDFTATVCSFACAHTLMTGGWQKLPDYMMFVGAKLIEASLVISTLVDDEEALREKHARAPERMAPTEIR